MTCGNKSYIPLKYFVDDKSTFIMDNFAGILWEKIKIKKICYIQQ